MIAFFRIIVVFIAFILITVLSCVFCLFRLRNTNNVYVTAYFMGRVSRLLGLKIELRIPDEVKALGPVVYVANHQSTYDIFTISYAVRPNTVSVGKKSLQWVPFFGQMYKLSGNILIDRKNTMKAMDTIEITAKNIKEKNMSVWLFPEGTRSNGSGLQPFKTGAFRTAQMANVPIVPICLSNIHNKIKLNRWDNGKLIIEFLPPTYITEENSGNIRKLTNEVHDAMLEKINEISIESDSPYPPYKKIVKKKK